MSTKQALDRDVWEGLFPESTAIGSKHLQDDVVCIWQQLWEESKYSNFMQVPVSLKIDYPQVKHTQAVLRMALEVADTAEKIHGTVVDRNVLAAGALLMDVSKFVEYQPGPNGANERTVLGERLPHGTAAAHLALEREMPMDVVHIVLVHSPNGGKPPGTIEAHILHWLDQLDLHAFGFDPWKRRVLHYQP